ncbi:MAG: hypothetical protein WCO84_01040 [bacterium]
MYNYTKFIINVGTATSLVIMSIIVAELHYNVASVCLIVTAILNFSLAWFSAREKNK